jgi:hypothetical protein
MTSAPRLIACEWTQWNPDALQDQTGHSLMWKIIDQNGHTRLFTDKTEAVRYLEVHS